MDKRLVGEGFLLGVEPVEVQGPLEDGLKLRLGVVSSRLLEDQAVAAVTREAPRNYRFIKGQGGLKEVRPGELSVFEGFLSPGIQRERLVLWGLHKFTFADLHARIMSL